MKKFTVSLLIFIVAFVSMGCLRRHVDTSLPEYNGTISGTLTYPLETLGTPGKNYVILSVDANVDRIIEKQEVAEDNTYSFSVPAGEYYISAYRDHDNDDSYTFGDEAIGGRLMHSYDYFRTFHPVVEKAKTVSVNPVLLHPFELRYPDHLTMEAELIPQFAWKPVAGADLYRIRVTDRTGKSMWIFDTAQTSVNYGEPANETDEESLAKAFPLYHGYYYDWVVLGLKKNGNDRDVIAYSRIWNFRTKLK